MTTNNPRIRGDFPFPLAGEGVVLRFNNVDCAHLQEKFHENWFLDAPSKLNRSDIAFMKECWATGAKIDGKPARIPFEQLDVPLAELSNALLDALYIAVMGRTFDKHLEYMDEQALLNMQKKEDESEGNK